jgi:hypothetical protein
MALPSDPQLTRYEHGTSVLLDGEQMLAEVRYHLVFPERAAHLTPRADQAPAVLQAFLHGAALALRLADGRVVPVRLTEHHVSGMWSAVLGPAEG